MSSLLAALLGLALWVLPAWALGALMLHSLCKRQGYITYGEVAMTLALSVFMGWIAAVFFFLNWVSDLAIWDRKIRRN